MYGGDDLEMGGMGQSVAPQVHLAVESVRKGFVRKVYSIVAVQLLATALLAAPIATASDLWLQKHAMLLLASTLGFLILAVSMTCCSHLLRQHPANLVILAAFTALESVSVGFVCAMYKVESVVLCMAATAAIVGALTLFAVTTKVDVTSMGGYLQATSLALFFLGLAGLFLRIPLLQAAYAFAGALLFSGYIVYDTQLVVGGKHQQKRMSIDDYVVAALSIYMDIVQLFIFILRMMGEERQDSRR